MVDLKVITSLLEQGGRYRMKFSGKQLEALPEHLKPLIKDIKDPVVHIGINGRGAEGSMYGAKVFAKGSKEPVAAVAGRVDYREAEPILQARGFVRKNRGEGEALRANLMLDTGKPFNIEAMDELAMHKAKDVYTVQARSNFANADIKVDRPAVEEIAGHMGFKIPTTQKLQKALEELRTGIKTGFNAGNPYKAEEVAAQSAKVSKASKVTEKAADKTADIEAYAKAARAEENLDAIKSCKEGIAYIDKKIEDVKKLFKSATDNSVKKDLAKQYDQLMSNRKEIYHKLKYFEG